MLVIAKVEDSNPPASIVLKKLLVKINKYITLIATYIYTVYLQVLHAPIIDIIQLLQITRYQDIK